MLFEFGRWRFAPRLVPTLAMLVVAIITVMLGNWQTRRAAEKLAQAWKPGEAPLELSASLVDAAAVDGRAVRLRGQFLPERTLYLDNRVLQGRAGYNVVTPLQMAPDGPLVLVNRGWIAVGQTRAVLPAVPVPQGQVQVEGMASIPVEKPYTLQQTAAEQGPLRQHLDLARLRAELGRPLQPFVILQTSQVDDGLLRDWPAPDSRVDVHRAYAFQWYAMAVLAVALWLGLQSSKRTEPR